MVAGIASACRFARESRPRSLWEKFATSVIARLCGEFFTVAPAIVAGLSETFWKPAGDGLFVILIGLPEAAVEFRLLEEDEPDVPDRNEEEEIGEKDF